MEKFKQNIANAGLLPGTISAIAFHMCPKKRDNQRLLNSSSISHILGGQI